MDQDTTEAALDRLLQRATRSAMATLNTRIDVARRLLDLHDEPDPPETGDAGSTAEALP